MRRKGEEGKKKKSDLSNFTWASNITAFSTPPSQKKKNVGLFSETKQLVFTFYLIHFKYLSKLLKFKRN